VAVYSSVLDLIGNTPIIDVSHLSPNPGVRILAKLESQNPAGSVKDRIALGMVRAAEDAGELVPGKTIIEPSSGNTGIALAMICRTKGYNLKIVLPENVTVERRLVLEAFGVEIIDSPAEEGSNGAVRRAQQISSEHPDWVFLYQYGNEANPIAHYETTGPEILADVPEITHFVAGLGTSGTLMGVGTFLKEQKPGVKLFAVEPPSGERVEGLRSLDDGYVPPVFEKWGGLELLDGKRIVRPADSLVWTRRLVNEAGIFAGISSGAAMAGAIKIAERHDVTVDGPATIVFIVSDGAWKYLSTGAYTDPIEQVIESIEDVIYF
jgi:cysteine synthase